jgi:CRP-like cAMP-binding protein
MVELAGEDALSMMSTEVLARSSRVRSAASCRNLLLRALPLESLERLWPQLESVPLQPKRVLHYPQTPMKHLYFPEEGLVSIVAHAGEGKSIEGWLVGREGFIGIPILLGEDVPSHRRVVQIGGSALRIRADAMQQAMEDMRPVRDLFLYYVHVVLMQTAQLSACNAAHSVQQRVARWLLMAQDHSGKDALPLTHDILARMLGIRRATVTDCIISLERSGMLEKARSLIQIVDRDRLKEAACPCYGMIRIAEKRLLGRCGKHNTGSSQSKLA